MTPRPRRSDILRAACQVTSQAAADWVVLAAAKGPCDVTNPKEKVPLTLPADVPEPLETLTVPEPVVLLNEEYTLQCGEVSGVGPNGAAVLIEVGRESEVLHWTDVPDISPAQLHRLSGLDLVDAVRGESVGVALAGVLEPAQITYVQQEVLRLKVSIRAAVEAMAVSALDCYWVNTVQTVRCVGTAAETTHVSNASELGVNNPSTIFAGVVQSRKSQSDANAQAASLARQALGCVILNDELQVTCAQLGLQEAVPNDDVSVVGRRRVGTTVVQAGLFSGPTKEEANRQAEAAGLALLDCFYLNTTLEVACAEIIGLEGAWTGSPVSVLEGRPGNPVTVPAGSVISEGPGASTSAANELARDSASSLLDCTFKNRRITLRCEAVTIGSTLYVPESASELVIEEGTYEAASQVEADTLAESLGRLQLQCRYCNSYIPPTCIPVGYTPPAGLPIPAGDVSSSWSIDATPGLAAGVICAEDPAQILPTAQAVAAVRLQVQDAGCTYVNETMWFGCLDAPIGATLPPGGYHRPTYASNAALPAGFEGIPLAEQLSPYSTPDPTAERPYIILEAGLYQVQDKDVPLGLSPAEYVNARARLYGLSLLDCKFANPELDLNCNTAYSGRFVQESVAQGAGQQVRVVIPRASYESLISFADAVNRARQGAQTALDCYYENDELLVSCWPDSDAGGLPPLAGQEGNRTRYGNGKVRRVWVQGSTTYSDNVDLKPHNLGSYAFPLLLPAGSFRSLVSKQEANTLALRSAVGSLDCAAQARDISECNDEMVVRCGGMVDPNPLSPYTGSANTIVTAAWTVDESGVINAGDGHNYVLSKNADGEWVPIDLGPSTDYVGGITGGVRGPGILIPACSMRANSKSEANRLAYMLGRSMLACTSDEPVPELNEVLNNLSGGETPGGGTNGNDGAQNGCEAECIAVYA